MNEHKNQGIEMAEPNQWSSIKRVVAVMSGKGGVGKSSVTSLAAVELRRRGLNVGILDGDITGPSIPRLFDVGRNDIKESEMGLLPALSKNGIQIISINLLLAEDTDPVVWRGPIIGNTIKQFFTDVIWNNIDVLLVDLPPGTGDAPLSTLQSIPLDGVVIVSSPQDVAVLVVEKAIKMVQLMNKPLLGLIENMSGIICPHCGERFEVLGKSQGEELSKRYGLSWLGSLPIDPALAELTGRIEEYRSPAEDTIRRLADVVEGK
ncbi:MAG TPA: Mrp/NBP35 family ATP-binding protein [Bacillota bacterium]|nr:Mrp/NBP35 family ATP-binding protein [Bacillota bacterium]